MGTFARAMSVQRMSRGRWTATIDPVWTIGDAVHGGCAQCVVVQAAVEESGHRHPVATTAHFLSPTLPGAVDISIEPLREGRTASTVRAVLYQHSEAKLAAHVTVATLGEQRPLYQIEKPAVPPPDVCMPRPDRLPDGSVVRFLEEIEVRIDPRHVGGPLDALSGVPDVRGWIRSRDGSPPDPSFLVFCVDALPPTVLEIGGGGWSPTVQLTTYIRALPAPGWLSVVSHAAAVGDGWFDEEAQVWDSAGRLVAQGRQLGRYRLGTGD